MSSIFSIYLSPFVRSTTAPGRKKSWRAHLKAITPDISIDLNFAMFCMTAAFKKAQVDFWRNISLNGRNRFVVTLPRLRASYGPSGCRALLEFERMHQWDAHHGLLDFFSSTEAWNYHPPKHIKYIYDWAPRQCYYDRMRCVTYRSSIETSPKSTSIFTPGWGHAGQREAAVYLFNRSSTSVMLNAVPERLLVWTARHTRSARRRLFEKS